MHRVSLFALPLVKSSYCSLIECFRYSLCDCTRYHELLIAYREVLGHALALCRSILGHIVMTRLHEQTFRFLEVRSPLGN